MEESKPPTCKYCESVFKSKSGLVQHLRTVTACVKRQEIDGITVHQRSYACETCNKKFSSTSSFKYHSTICKEKLKKINESQLKEHALMKLQLAENQKQIEMLMKKMETIETTTPSIQTTNNTTNSNNSNNSNNNTINNINNITIQSFMTEEKMAEIFQKEIKKINDFMPKNFATFTANHLVNGVDKPLYFCTDPSRQRVVYLDASGNQQVDENFKLLIEHVMKAKPCVNDMFQEYVTHEEQEEIDRLKAMHDTFLTLHQNRTYKSELSKQLPRNEESARKKKVLPTKAEEIDWEINDKLKEKEETKRDVSERQNNADFFPQEDDDY